MRPSKSGAYFKARSTFFLNFIAVSLFDLKAGFSAPTHMSREPTRAGAVKVGRHCGSATSINVSRPHLDSSEHDGTLAVVGMTMSRGARFCSVEDLAPHPCIRWTIESVTMMHGCASVSEAPRRGPILLCGMKAMLQRADDRHLEPSSAIR